MLESIELYKDISTAKYLINDGTTQTFIYDIKWWFCIELYNEKEYTVHHAKRFVLYINLKVKIILPFHCH